jgi:hypothetical protein
LLLVAKTVASPMGVPLSFCTNRSGLPCRLSQSMPATSSSARLPSISNPETTAELAEVATSGKATIANSRPAGSRRAWAVRGA